MRENLVQVNLVWENLVRAGEFGAGEFGAGGFYCWSQNVNSLWNCLLAWIATIEYAM